MSDYAPAPDAVTSDLRALIDHWRQQSKGDGVHIFFASALEICADQLEPLLLRVDAQARAAEDARMGHVRLDETRAKETKGRPLYDRISWLIELLSHENAELRHNLLATGHEKDALVGQLGAAEHRRAAAEYRAQRIVLDAELVAKVDAQAQEWQGVKEELDGYRRSRDEHERRLLTIAATPSSGEAPRGAQK